MQLQMPLCYHPVNEFKLPLEAIEAPDTGSTKPFNTVFPGRFRASNAEAIAIHASAWSIKKTLKYVLVIRLPVPPTLCSYRHSGSLY
jgi:hypothetical protein